MDILSERRRALMMSVPDGPNGLVNGSYTNTIQEGSVLVTDGNTTTMAGRVAATNLMLPLIRPVKITSDAYIYQTITTTTLGADIGFWYSDGTTRIVTHTLSTDGSDTHFDVPATDIGKTLIGVSVGRGGRWYDTVFTWSLVVDGKTIF